MRVYDPKLFAGTAKYYARYRVPYPPALFSHLRRTFSLDGAGALLDLGCGTGELALLLSRDFSRVTAVDPDAGMLREGRRKGRAQGASNVTWSLGAAETFPLKERSFRLVTVGAAFHWFDRPLVLDRVRGALEDKGGLVVVSGKSTWRKGGAAQRAAKSVIQKYLGTERRAGGSLFSTLHRMPLVPFTKEIRDAGFSHVRVRRFRQKVTMDTDAFLGYLYSTSFARRALFGKRRPAFERDLRAALFRIDPSGVFENPETIEAITARK